MSAGTSTRCVGELMTADLTFSDAWDCFINSAVRGIRKFIVPSGRSAAPSLFVLPRLVAAPFEPQVGSELWRCLVTSMLPPSKKFTAHRWQLHLPSVLMRDLIMHLCSRSQSMSWHD